MGKLAQDILGLDKADLLRELNRAYADEWCAHYNYLFVANTLSGPATAEVIPFIRDKSYRALEQANRFAVRISELGAQPVMKMKDLLEAATDKPFKLPGKMNDRAGVLRAVLDAERTAIRTYKTLYDKVTTKDPVTLAIILDCLTKAIQDEDKIERFLDDAAPQMTGR